MSLAILGLGTALPPAAFNQAEALQVARALCCRTEEQVTWLPAIYGNTGIACGSSKDHFKLTDGKDFVAQTRWTA